MNSDSKLSRDKLTLTGIVCACATWVFCLLATAVFWAKLPPQLPFFFSLPWGEAWLIPKTGLIWILGGFGLILLVNILLAKTLVKVERLLQNYLIWGAVAAEGIFAIGLVKIIDLIV